MTLKAVLGMINDMVNRETMLFFFNDPNSEIRFNSMTHKAYFNILLVDFLSVPREFFKDQKSYLERLQGICINPLLAGQHIQDLREAVQRFSDWLSQPVTVEKCWFPSIELAIDLKLSRKDFIIMCGNISKHNFTQQTRQANKLLQILSGNGQAFPIDKCLVALEDFYEQFYDGILNYHASTIAEFLNNIRWGIYSYASAERSRCVSYWYDDEMKIQRWSYAHPPDVESDLGKTYYQNLMDDVIREPYIPRFEVTKYLKMRY